MSSLIFSRSELARLAAVAPATARKFMRYLELSYQVVMLLDKPLLLGLVVSNDGDFGQVEDLPLWNGAAAQRLG